MYWPEGLLLTPVRASFHVAFEADRFEAHELFHVLQPLLATEDRFRELLDHSERLALGARLRLATLCQRLATALDAFGPEALARGERVQLLDGVLERLLVDRDPGVGLRAAWACGLRALSSKAWRKTLADAAAPGSSPRDMRRALAARTALWVHGEVDHDEFVRELRAGLGKKDPNALATAILAMRFGLRMAPDTIVDTASALVSKAPEVLVAVADLAWALPEAARERLLERVREHAPASGQPAALSFLLGPRSPHARKLRSLHQALVEAATRSPADAAKAAEELASALTHASADPEEQEACERVLFDGTLFRDALLVATGDAAARRRAYDTWLQAVATSRTARLVAVAALPGPDAAGAWRRASRALDAAPRGPGRDGKPQGDHATRLRDDASRLRVTAARRLLEVDLSGAEERPATAAFVVAAEVEMLTAPEVAGSALAILLCAPSSRVVRHAVQTASGAELRDAFLALEVVRARMDALAPTDGGEKKSAEPPRDPAAARNELQRLAAAARRLVENPDARLPRALTSLASAVDLTLGSAAPGVLVEAWRTALAHTGALRTEVAEAVSAARISIPGQPRVDKALAALFEAHGPKPGMLRDEAARRAVSALLPPGLASLLEALRPRDTPLPPTPRRKLSFGFKQGQVISDFVVESVLGGGNMGVCLEVSKRTQTSKRAPERYVIKIPRGTDPGLHHAFVDEARTLLTLSQSRHPGVVHFFGYMTCAYRKPFLVMQHVSGPSLEARLHHASMKPQEILFAGERLASALAHCHAHGVTHHDLKPANVIVGAEGPVLVDFGIAGAAGANGAGTPLYMSPERFDGSYTVAHSSAADVFALACVLHEMWTRAPLLSVPIENIEAHGIPKEVVSLSHDLVSGNGNPLAVMLVLGTIARERELLMRRVHAGLGQMPDGLRAPLAPLLDAMLQPQPASRPSAAAVARELSRVAGSFAA